MLIFMQDQLFFFVKLVLDLSQPLHSNVLAQINQKDLWFNFTMVHRFRNQKLVLHTHIRTGEKYDFLLYSSFNKSEQFILI